VDLRPLWNLRELPAHYYNEGIDAARQGNLDLALAKLLCALEVSGGDADLWALLGKVCWERGDRAQAARYWKRGLELDPMHVVCLLLLRRAARDQTLRRAAAAVAALALVAAVASGGWFARDRALGAGPLALAPVAARTDASQFAATALPMDRVTLLPVVSAEQPDAVLQRVARRLAAEPDFRAERAGAELRISFAEGLFGAGSDDLTPSGVTRLRKLAAILDRAESRLFVTVAGAPDAAAGADRGTLAQARAQGAIGVMLTALGPRGNAALRPAVLDATAFPSGSDRARARDRSVVLSVWATGSAPASTVPAPPRGNL
jgi:tetratricopeptide (TPR) repeat protein